MLFYLIGKIFFHIPDHLGDGVVDHGDLKDFKHHHSIQYRKYYKH